MLKILFGILFFAVFLNSAEYIFSYRVAVKNGIILNERYNFSPTMVHRNLLKKAKNPYKSCEILHESQNEREFLNKYKEKVLECFFNWGVRLKDESSALNLQAKSLTHLEIPPTRIVLEYEKGVATLYALIRKNKL